MIEKIAQDRRPSPSLIKLIESVGFLLGVPLSKKKSAYKAPLPSNYDQTLQLLLDDFYGTVVRLSRMQSADLDNEVALSFYNKMLEPGFDYEDALAAGGLLVRELFNCVQLVLLQLQSDLDRVPVLTHNVCVLVDGTQSGQIALDSAAHVCRHGTLHAIVCSAHRDSSDAKILTHLQSDVQRRCRTHFKLMEHTFKVHNGLALREQVMQTRTEDAPLEQQHPDRHFISLLQHVIEQERCETVVVGLQEPHKFDSLDAIGSLGYWATHVFPGDAVLVKSVSFLRPFNAVATPRRFIVYIEANREVRGTFLKALRHVRPGDEVIALSVFPTRDPQGDNRDLRFDFGTRHSTWLKTEDALKEEASRVGWNDVKVEEFTEKVQEMMRKSFLSTSRVRIERETPGVSVGEMIFKAAFEEAAAALLIDMMHYKEVVVQAVRDTTTTVVLLK